jgi:hypothetical protein
MKIPWRPSKTLFERTVSIAEVSKGTDRSVSGVSRRRNATAPFPSGAGTETRRRDGRAHRTGLPGHRRQHRHRLSCAASWSPPRFRSCRITQITPSAAFLLCSREPGRRLPGTCFSRRRCASPTSSPPRSHGKTSRIQPVVIRATQDPDRQPADFRAETRTRRTPCSPRRVAFGGLADGPKGGIAAAARAAAWGRAQWTPKVATP